MSCISCCLILLVLITPIIEASSQENKQDREYTYNVTLRHVCATIVALEKLCVCSLRYPACDAIAPFCRLSPAWLCRIFPRYLIHSMSFEELLNVKCVFWFSLQLLSATFLILSRIERDMVKNVYWSSHKYPLFLSGSNETWIFLTDLLKIFKYQILWKSIQWELSCIRTDGHDEANSRFLQLFERALKLNYITCSRTVLHMYRMVRCYIFNL